MKKVIGQGVQRYMYDLYAEQVNGTCAPAGFWELVDRVGAVDVDEWYEEDAD